METNASAQPPPNAAAGAGTFLEVEVGKLHRDPLHRRAKVDTEYIRELGDSIKTRGVIMALAVRPHPDKPGEYLVAAGECRRRAAVMVRVPLVPCVVRDMTDEDVLEVQLHENLKRRNLHPMDEAELFEGLHKRGRTVNQIAERFGCDPRFVRARLKLCSLTRSARELYVSGALSDFAALAIARVDNPEVQVKFAQDAAREDMTDARVLELAAQRYWLPLAKAPWDLTDDKLAPDAGACVQCPKRSLSQMELFKADLYARPGVAKSDDYCLDAGCWKGKLDLHWIVLKGDAERDGREVLAPHAAAAVFVEFATPGERRKVRGAEYVDGDAPSAVDPDQTWAQVIGEGEVPVIARDPDGHPRRLYSAKAARGAQRARKPPRTAVGDHAAAERKASRDQAKSAQAESVALVEACARAAQTANVADVLAAIVPAAVTAMQATAETVAKRRGLDGVDGLLADARGQVSARSILVEILLTEAADQADAEPGEVPEVITLAAKALGVDVREVRREARKAGAQ